MWRGRKAPAEKRVEEAEESAESSDGETEASRDAESDAEDSRSDSGSDDGSNGNEIVDGDKGNKQRARVARDEEPSNGKRGLDASDAATRGKNSSPSAVRLPWLTWLALTGSYLVALILAFSVLRATLPAHKDPLAPCKFPPSANAEKIDDSAISAAANGSELANATRSTNATCPVPWHPAVDVLTWRWSPLAAAAAVLGFMICALRALGSGLAELNALEERLRALEGGGGGRGGRLGDGGAEGEEGGSGRGRGAEGFGGVSGSEGGSEGGSDGRAVVTAGSKLAVSVGRSSLLGILVHEIRAALRGVLGLLQLLLSSSLDESQRDMLAAIQATARHVIHVANNVVDSWRIENRRIAAASSAAASSAAAAIFRGERGGGGGGGGGRAGAVERGSVVRLGLESAVFDLRCVVDEVVLLVAGEAREKGVELAALVMDSVPTVAVGDPLRLRQILANLMAVAVRLTDRGHVFLVVRLAPDDDEMRRMADPNSSEDMEDDDEMRRMADPNSPDDMEDEFLLFDDAAAPLHPDDLPRRRLDDWALYDDQLRFVPLELLPMLPGVAADSLVFGSGVMMEDDGSGFSLDDPTVESAGTTRGDGAGGSLGGASGGSAGGSGASGGGSGSGSNPAGADGDGGGIRVYLSAIKEWMIEFGAGMLFVTIRTDGAWYRLGRPCAAYVPWYRPVLRTARLAIRVIEMLSGESRAARLSFLDVVTKLAQERVAEKQQKSGKVPARGDLAKCFAEMERFLVVHGNIILQQFREYPVETIRRSPFISTLREKMEMRSHTELKVSKKKAAMIVTSRGSNGRGGGDGGSARNANPAAALRPDASKRKPMRATTTQLVHRIWKEYYERFGLKRDERAEADKEAGVADKGKAAAAGGAEKAKEAAAGSKPRAVKDSTQGVTWIGASTGRTEEDHPAYAAASVWGLEVKAGIVVLAAVAEGDDDGDEGRWKEEEEKLVLVEYMWDEGAVGGGAGRRRRGEGMKAHGRVMVRGSETVLGNAADEWELFVSEHCVDFPLTAIRELAAVTHRKQPWGAEHRLRNMEEHERERERMEKLFKETGQRSFFYRLLYNPSRGGFFDLPKSLGSGTGRCCSCDEDTERDRMMEVRRLGDGKVGKEKVEEEGFAYLGKEFRVQDFVFLHPAAVGEESEGKKAKIAKGGRNIGLRAWPIGQIEKFVAPTGGAKEVPEKMVVRRFFRPEDVPNEGDEIAYTAHIREVYYSETLITVDVTDVIGKCRVQRGKPTAAAAGTEADHSGFNIGGCLEEELMGGDFVFFCDRLLKDGSVRMLPPGIRFGPSSAVASASPVKDKGKGKGKSVATDDDADADAAAAEAAAAARARAKGKGKAAAADPEEPISKAADGAKQQQGKQEKAEKLQDGQQGAGNSSNGSAGVLRTLDIFAGCGGLSEGLQRSGACETRWAIEYEHPAAEAFQKNHPEAAVICANCNVVLRSMMEQAGQLGDCVSTPEADEAAAKMAEAERGKLPLPGQVDFVNGGPPCQGFSGMNRFNQNPWSKVQCEMILAFLSFADFLRPNYFLLENVRNFVSFNGARTFRLALRTLLAMGYQVRFGVLQAGNFGISQSRTRAFIWAAAPGHVLPEWPQPLHVFASSQLSVPLTTSAAAAAGAAGGAASIGQFSTASSLANEACPRGLAIGAPLRSITVRDAMGDLPSIENGAEEEEMEYSSEPSSWFQRCIRSQQAKLLDHTCKKMNELNLKRCQHIPRRPGADWRDLPDIKVRLSDGREADLVPWCLPNTMERHNNWKGLFGRLDWAGNFPTSVTDPQPMGKVGMCFHPEQDRIVSVRECARSQGFPNWYRFAGNIQAKHRQIGNAVPPSLALALGLQLRKALLETRKLDGAQVEGGSKDEAK
ncbi:unnamed protein product [Closterium sp. Yama58-4]|nr:unnamed protein product [Closterium sp. Yama58-4]